MQKLNDKKASQIEALNLIDRKLNELYIKLISSNSYKTQIVHFDLTFSLKEGSVSGNVSFEEVAKLK